MPSSLSPELLEQLAERAAQCGLTPDALLRRWLNTADPIDALYLRSILASQTAYILRTNLDGIITYCNEHFTKVYKGLGEHMLGKSALETIIPQDHPKTLETSEWCIHHPNTPRQVVLRKPTSATDYLWTLWEFTGLTDETGAVCEIQCVGFEITEQVGAQEALRESEERYRIVTELTSDFAFAYRISPDQTATLEWITGSFQQVTGYTREELSDASRYSLYEAEIVPQIRHKSGEQRWLRIQRQPIWDSAGTRVARFYGVAQDITEQRRNRAARAEQERLTSILDRERRWNTHIGQMVRVLSHELRVPLAVINSSSDLIQRFEHLYGPEQRAEKVAVIKAQVRRITQVIEDAVGVVRGMIDSPLQLREVNLLNLCRACIQDIHSSFGANHRILIDSDGTPCPLVTDETLFSRILLNLLSNAVKYSPPIHPITLHLRCNGQHLRLSVQDHGIGIPTEEHGRVFEPLFRAENARNGDISGTGLGLSIVRDSVEKLGGTISFVSALGEGTTFTVELPCQPNGDEG